MNKQFLQTGNSLAYQQKRDFFDKLITLYGRNVVLEVLQNSKINIHKLHLANSNKNENSLRLIVELAKQRKIPIVYHDKKALSRISKNSKQDQGVAADIEAPSYIDGRDVLKDSKNNYRLLALDGIHNPQNLGMIIRSAAAGKIDGIILPKNNSAKISPLVIKASAGTLFKINIFYCQTLVPVLKLLKQDNAQIYALSLQADDSLFNRQANKKEVFILGNEHDGVSQELAQLTTQEYLIPMNRGVESLNVAVTAALIAYL